MRNLITLFAILLSNLCYSQSSYWSTYFGGKGIEFCRGTVCDKQNNIYVFGQTDSSNNITTNGAHQISYGGGGSDGILAKFDKNGNLLWATYYGGSDGDFIYAASVDNNDNIVIAGISFSINNISTPGSFQEIGPGGSFVAKFNSNGVQLWGTYFNYGAIRSVCTDKLGNIFFCGYTNTISGLSTPGAYHPNYLGNYDGFLVKFNPNGNRLWSTYYGGNGNEDCFSCATDNSNNILISGYTESDTGISTAGAAQININGVGDSYVAKFNSSGNILWSTYLGGSDYEEAYSLCADKNNNVIVGGTGISNNGIATPGAYKMLPDGQDAFIVKYDSTGIKKWGTYYGGPDGIMDVDKFHQVTVNKNDEIFIVGNTSATTGIATAGSYRSSNSGYTDGYFAKFSPLGLLVWGSYFGGNIGGDVLGIAIDSLSNIIIAGNTSSDSNIATNGAYQTVYGGGTSDAFIASFDSTGHITAIPFLNNANKNNLLQVYPNPTKDKIVVYLKSYTGKEGSLKLQTIEGKLLKQFSVKAEETSIDLKELAIGVYLLEYIDGEVCETVKVVKE